MPKAGSTVLQSRFKAARGALRRHGILYPGRGLNHNFLAAGVMRPDELPRIFRQHYRGREDDVAAEFRTFWEDIKARRDRFKPDIMVMSGEALWNLRAGQAEALGKLLAGLADEVTVVVYVRRPSEFYLSATQQRLKASSKIGAVGAVPYRSALEALARVAGPPQVLAYDRVLFPDGDICADFEQRFLGGAGFLAATGEAVAQENVSMSAEAMAIVQNYRREIHGDRQSVFTRDTGALMKAMRAVDEGARPRLRPEIAQRIDASSPDLLWLRDRFGISFADIDYAAIAEAPGWTPAQVADICAVDEDARERLVLRAIAELLRDEAESEVKFRTVFRERKRDAAPAAAAAPADEDDDGEMEEAEE